MTHDALFYVYRLPDSSASLGNRSRVAGQVALMVENPPASAGDVRDAGLIPGSGGSPGGGKGNPLQYSCLRNPMDGGALWALVHRVMKNQTCLKQPSTHIRTHTRVAVSTINNQRTSINYLPSIFNPTFRMACPCLRKPSGSLAHVCFSMTHTLISTPITPGSCLLLGLCSNSP